MWFPPRPVGLDHLACRALLMTKQQPPATRLRFFSSSIGVPSRGQRKLMITMFVERNMGRVMAGGKWRNVELECSSPLWLKVVVDVVYQT